MATRRGRRDPHVDPTMWATACAIIALALIVVLVALVKH
jgi:hypothetical protein